MNNINLKILLVLGAMLSTPVFALSSTLQQQMKQVDNAIATVAPPGSQTSQTTYLQYVQQQIDSLSGFGPVAPFMQCNLVKFQLTDNGFTMQGGSANSCATSSGLNPAGSATAPSASGGSSGGASLIGGSSSGGSSSGGGTPNYPQVPDWSGGVFQ